ncbi:MAG: dockerin type I domain-containing protein [Verrucomicrobiota bacterium]
MRPLLLASLSFFVLSGSAVEGGSRSSADYRIPTETIASAGINALSASYSLRGSAFGEFGAAAPGSITSASYIDKPGYAGQLSDLLMLAVSEIVHGAAGAFDINLPLSGLAGVECRSSSAYTIVFKFANPLTSVTSVTATATGPIQPGPSSGSIDPMDAHNYIANLTTLPNAQYITVTLNSVNDSDGNVSSNVPAVMGLLIGDSNANSAVNSADIAQTKSRIGQVINGTNFRSDVNANGAINSGDVANIKSNIGSGLP